MASIYREGNHWSARIRKTDMAAFKTGFRTRTEAESWAQEREHIKKTQGSARGMGPDRTSLAQALFDYVQKTLPFKKGAIQDLSRANKYLRATGLETFKAIPSPKMATDNNINVLYYTLELVPHSKKRSVAKGLHEHRKKQAERSTNSDNIRDRIARKMVAEIQPYHLQELIDQLQQEGYAPATIHLERAFLREFFNYARRTWRWPQPASNPASDIRLPKVNNARSRVLSEEEQVRLEEALVECKNPQILTCVVLLVETTMRQSELVNTATWGNLDIENRILTLPTAKAGGRQVPLTKEAAELLSNLPRGSNHERIFNFTLEALKAAWKRAVARAGLENLKIHDLRHTGATRLAIRFNGNIFLLQLATGHKTLSQLQRYVNLTAADAVKAFDRTSPSSPQSNSPIQMEMARTNVLCLASARARKIG